METKQFKVFWSLDKLTCKTPPQNGKGNENADDYEDVIGSSAPAVITPNVYAELTPISGKDNDYQINVYQNNVKGNTGV